jgi:hypothetical protein
MNVGDQGLEIGIVSYGFAFEVLFEKAAATVVGFVDGFGVGAKKSSELLA